MAPPDEDVSIIYVAFLVSSTCAGADGVDIFADVASRTCFFASAAKFFTASVVAGEDSIYYSTTTEDDVLSGFLLTSASSV